MLYVVQVMSENAHIIYTFFIQLKHTGTGDDGIAI